MQDVVSISTMQHFHFGRRIRCSDGEAGLLTQVVFDCASRRMTALGVRLGHLFGRSVYVSFAMVVPITEDSITLRISRADLADSRKEVPAGALLDSKSMVETNNTSGTAARGAIQSQPEHNFDRKQAGMDNLNDMPGPLLERGLCAPLASQGSTLSRKDADRAKPNQSGIHPDQQQISAKTVSDVFEPIKTWDDKATKRVGRSLRRHLERVIRFAKDPPFEQEVKKRVGKLLASEGAFAETIAQTSRSHTYKVAGHIPLWRTHHIALTMGFEVVNDTFGTLMQQDPYYQVSTILKERVFIRLFASELNQPDKQDIIFWMKQGGTIVYRKLSKPIHNRPSLREG